MAFTLIDYMAHKTMNMLERKFDEAILKSTQNGDEIAINFSVSIEFASPVNGEVLLDILLKIEDLYEKAGWDCAVITRNVNSYRLNLTLGKLKD